jgi:hypothetical protein
MKNARIAIGLALIAALLPGAGSAGSDKQVQNMKGSVAYQRPNKQPKPIASQATIALADQDTTITGEASLAAVTLPDSSQVMVGSNSKVQLAFFNQANIANAKFVVYQGKFRFTVNHPGGARANYTFTTPSAQIGVRGTQGDLEVDSSGKLTVNVYDVSDPNLPVQVTTSDGHTYLVKKGQTLALQIVNGIVQAEVTQLTQGAIDQFTGDFGVPTNMAELKATILSHVPCPWPAHLAHLC